MISKKHRFHGHNSVSRVRGGRAQSQHLKVFYSRKTNKQDYRMAVVVSKKISKSAVVRNRIRRRIFESVRTQKILENHRVDVVFVVHSVEIETIPSKELNDEIKKACLKIVSSP